MKNLAKKITSALVALMIMFGALPAINLGFVKKQSHASSAPIANYYGSQLKGKEVDFYNAIASMYVGGVFISQGSYDLVAGGVVATNDIVEYSQGNRALMVAFNNAKDAYMLDHPELFYVDFAELSLSMGVSAGKYVATLDCGKFDNYFKDAYTTATASAGVQKINGQNGYSKFLPANGVDTEDKVVQVARNIANAIVPSQNEANGDIYCAVNGLASAEGYAKLFKHCMDKLNISCVVVKGFYSGESFDTPARHYWNCVQIDGKWFAIDIYMNDVLANEDYLIVRAEKMTRHIAQTSTYGTKEFDIPNVESFRIEKKYTKQNMLVNVLYNGMNAHQLLQFSELYIVQVLDETSSSVSAKALFEDTMQNSYIEVDHDPASVTYAITATAPDEFSNGYYDDLQKSDIILMETFDNEVGFDDIVRPIASKINIGVVGEAEGVDYSLSSSISADNFMHVVITYDNNLKQMGSTVGVVAKVNGVSATASIVENVVWNSASPKVVEFDFKPADLYCAGDVIFSFELEGLVSAGINNDDTLARPAYIKVDYSSRSFDFASQNTNVLKENNMPYLDSGFNVSSVVLKDSGMQTVDAKAENLMLVSKAVDKNIQNKIDVQGDEEYFYSLNFIANGKVVSLADGFVNIVFPFENQKQYDDLKDKVVKVFTYDENGDNAQELSAAITKYGVVAVADQMGNFKVVYGGAKQVQEKKLYVKLDNGFGTVSSTGLDSAIDIVDGSVTLNIIPSNGFDIDYVILNGQNISNRVSNKNITISKNELEENSVLQIGFMSSQRKLVFAQNGYESLDDEFASSQQLEFVVEETPEPDPEPKSKTTILLIIIDWRRAKRWMIFFTMRLQCFVKRQNVY